MAKKTKIIRDFMRINDPLVETRAQFVFAGLFNNPLFPAPTPTMQELDTSIKKFQGLLSDAQNRDKVKVILKNNARTELQTILSRLADYVSMMAVGDRAMMATTGFLLNSETTSPRVLEPVENFAAVQGANSGEVDLSLTRADAAEYHTFYFTEAPAASTTDLTGWKHKGSKKAFITLKGLKPATLFSFIVVVSGPNEQEVYSEVITKMFL